MCVFSPQFVSGTFLILRRIARDMVQMCVGLNVMHSFLLSEFNDTWISSTDFRKILISNFIKISQLFHEDGRTDRRKEGWTDRQTLRNYQSLFAILRTCLAMDVVFFPIKTKILLKQWIFINLGSWDKQLASNKISIYQQIISQENVNSRTPSKILTS